MLRSIALMVLILAFGLSACDCFGEPSLEYMFEEDDPAALVPINFPIGEIPRRLDESGNQHHGSGLGEAPDVTVVMLDNACQEAWFRTEPGTRALRIVGLEATGSCNKAGTREELVRVFKDEFVARLEGTRNPLPYTNATEGEFFQYPAGGQPVLTLSGSLDEARQRFDDGFFFDHEYHDGVYYLAPFACSGRFRVIEVLSTNSVRIEGMGYVKPCEWSDDQACLTYWFSFALFVSPSAVTPVGTRCPLPGED